MAVVPAQFRSVARRKATTSPVAPSKDAGIRETVLRTGCPSPPSPNDTLSGDRESASPDPSFKERLRRSRVRSTVVPLRGTTDLTTAVEVSIALAAVAVREKDPPPEMRILSPLPTAPVGAPAAGASPTWTVDP